MFSTLAFAFKIIKHIIFFCSQESKFLTVKELFYNQGIFPQLQKFSTIKELFHSCVNFPQLRNFSTVKEFFHSCGNFPESRNFSTIKEFFHTQENFSQIISTKKQFSTNFFSLDQGGFS